MFENLSPLLMELLKPILATLATAIAGYLIALLRKKLQQAGVEFTDSQREAIEKLAREKILWVAEQVAKLIKGGQQPPSSIEKLRMAVTEMQKVDPSIKTEVAERVVEAVLPTTGLGAASEVEAKKQEAARL